MRPALLLLLLSLATPLLAQPAEEELKSWLDLHLNKNVPTTLLLMSRAFKITQKDRSEEGAIKETLQAMSKEATNRHAFSKL